MEDYTWLKEAIDRDFPIFYGQWQIEQENQNKFLERELIRYFSNAGSGSKKSKMSSKLRAKFVTSFVTDFGNYSKVEMNAVYSSKKNTEDNQFSEATPSGKLEMMISAKGAKDFLKPGCEIHSHF